MRLMTAQKQIGAVGTKSLLRLPETIPMTWAFCNRSNLSGRAIQAPALAPDD